MTRRRCTLKRGDIVRNGYGKRQWYGRVISVLKFGTHNWSARVQPLVTQDGRLYRKARRQVRRDPHWFTVVSTYPLRPSAPRA